MGGFLGGLGAGLQGATTGFRNYNALQQQALQNQLAQQQMLMNQQRLALEAQQQQLQARELQWNQGHERYNQLQQQAQWHTTASGFQQMRANATDPKEALFWDKASNMAYNGAPVETIMKMAAAEGYGDEFKQWMEFQKGMYMQQKGAESAATTNILNRVSGSLPGGPVGGPGTITPMTGPTTPPMPSSPYAGGMGVGTAPTAATPPTGGGTLGGLGTPVGRTDKYRNTMTRKGSEWYYVDASGNVYGPIPTAPDSMARATP